MCPVIECLGEAARAAGWPPTCDAAGAQTVPAGRAENQRTSPDQAARRVMRPKAPPSKRCRPDAAERPKQMMTQAIARQRARPQIAAAGRGKYGDWNGVEGQALAAYARPCAPRPRDRDQGIRRLERTSATRRRRLCTGRRSPVGDFPPKNAKQPVLVIASGVKGGREEAQAQSGTDRPRRRDFVAPPPASPSADRAVGHTGPSHIH